MKRARPWASSSSGHSQRSTDEDELKKVQEEANSSPYCNAQLPCGFHHKCQKPKRHPEPCGLGHCTFIRMHGLNCGHTWLGPCDYERAGVRPPRQCDALCQTKQKCSHRCQRACYACNGNCGPLNCDKCEWARFWRKKESRESGVFQEEFEDEYECFTDYGDCDDYESSMTSTAVSSTDGGMSDASVCSGMSSDLSFASWFRGMPKVNSTELKINGDLQDEDSSSTFDVPMVSESD